MIEQADTNKIKQMCNKHTEIFDSNLKTIPNCKAHFYPKHSAKPAFLELDPYLFRSCRNLKKKSNI